jgi:pyrimidine-nucleoside phosphorylase
LDDGRALAETMIDLGIRAKREVVCLLTDMDQPLGRAVGNALELREALATIRGEGPPDFAELVLSSVAHLLALSDLGIGEAEGRRRAEQAIADGSAVEAYERWIHAQGGDPAEDALPAAPLRTEVLADGSGFVDRLGAIQIGVAALELGAGRRAKEDDIDHAVGVLCLKKRGDAVESGEPLAEIHARDEAAASEAAGHVLAAYELAGEAPRSRPIILDVLG